MTERPMLQCACQRRGHAGEARDSAQAKAKGRHEGRAETRNLSKNNEDIKSDCAVPSHDRVTKSKV